MHVKHTVPTVSFIPSIQMLHRALHLPFIGKYVAFFSLPDQQDGGDKC